MIVLCKSSASEICGSEGFGLGAYDLGDGPTRLLHPGSVFELYEGRRLVARGEVT